MITSRFNENFRRESDLPSGQYDRETASERDARLELDAKVNPPEDEEGG